MSSVIPVAHDFSCGWCWIGLHQVEQLSQEFDVTFEWKGFELMPEALAWDDPVPVAPEPPNRPETPSRFRLALYASGVELPAVARPRRMRTHNALQAAAYASHAGKGHELVAKLYRAYWEQGLEINRTEVILELAADILPDLDDLKQAIEERRHAAEIVPYDDEAYAAGVYNIPTFFIGDERYAEQPTAVLRAAIQRTLTP